MGFFLFLKFLFPCIAIHFPELFLLRCIDFQIIVFIVFICERAELGAQLVPGQVPACWRVCRAVGAQGWGLPAAG